MKLKPSKYQTAIYQAAQTTNKNLGISATAGSGKSTTLVEISKLLPYGKRIVFVAFNKSIVNELKEKLPRQVECSTMHSLGCRAIFRHFQGNKKIVENKQYKFIEPFFQDEHPRKKWPAIASVDELMTKARVTMTQPNKEALDKLIEDHAMDVEDGHVNVAIKALRKFYDYNDNAEYDIEIDFTDMIEMCVRNRDIKVPLYDVVLADELQDMSVQDHIFLSRLVMPVTGRMVGVGDGFQSIYGFRGASPASFEEFMNKPNTVKLPLSISYRCAKNIVKEAKTVCPDIEPFEENEDGIVRVGKVEEICEGDMVLCRNTRPLISVFLRLIDAGKKASIVGKDMEKGLLALLANFDSDAKTNEVVDRLHEALDKLADKLKERGIKAPENHPKYVALEEKMQIVELLFDKFDYVHEVEKFIEQVFNNDDRDGVRLLTIHKSKGMENNRVFVIEKFEGRPLIPSRYAVTKDQLIQENNLRFVSLTRAKKELVKLYL